MPGSLCSATSRNGNAMMERSKNARRVPTVIRVDGTQEVLKDTKLKSLQDAVGGMIEIVQLGLRNRKFRGVIMIVNENGISEQLPENVKGTNIWIEAIGTYNPILGDIIVCDERDID